MYDALDSSDFVDHDGQALVLDPEKVDAKLKRLRDALQAARDWIVENTSCEPGSTADEIMYERGWWDRDVKLIEQIEAALRD